MNLLDLIILLPIAYFAYKGVKNGLIGELLGIIGIIVAVYLTFEYMDKGAALASSFLGGQPDMTLTFIAALFIFIATLILAQLINYFSRKFFQFVKLQSLNRILGGCFGLIKGAIIVSVVLLIFAGFQIPSKKMRAKSATYSYVVKVAPRAYNLVASQDFVQTIEQTFDISVEDFPILNE